MRRSFIFAPLVFAALIARAEEPRQLGAHVHGVSHLDVAVEGQTLEMALVAPGMDIVGFEHAPSSPAGESAVAEALAALRDPLALFVLPDAAGCTLDSVEAGLEREKHDGDDEEEHDHDHDDGGHSEFTATYRLTCAEPARIDEVRFHYFDRFEAAQRLALRIVTRNGAKSFDVERESPLLSLKGKL